MSKEIGVVICNFNKKDFVLDSVQSVLESKNVKPDIFVVDNASSDGSAEALKEKYSDSITVIENSENLGGSGGFNTGLRRVRDEGYKYFFCLDDDAQVDENALSVLYEYMEANPDVGMAGCRVYHMQMPDHIQQSGLMIDFDHCSAKTIGADRIEDGSLPDVIECDTVATCAVMVRGDVARRDDVGIMPEDNFIYWDDMEWGHRIHLAGFRVVTHAAAKALHQMGAIVRRPNTFINYYMWRNRTNFFLRYTPEKMLDSMTYQLLSAFFDALYECMYREEHNIKTTIALAYQDALTGVRGKDDGTRILENDANDDKLIRFIRSKNSFYLKDAGFEDDAVYLRNFFEKEAPKMQEAASESEAEVVFELCDNIFAVKDFSLKTIYIDIYRNALIDDEDVVAISNYDYNKILYIYMNQDIVLDAVRRLRRIDYSRM
ncbi:MAG: glycosyltransferase family 2 protein [Eubacterium sp.]|nr:glycosyltransferase family 2 protein [Eubacterium sp.]